MEGLLYNDENLVSHFSCIDVHVCDGGNCTECECHNVCDMCDNQYSEECDECMHNY